MSRYLKIYEAGKMSGYTFDEMNGWRAELKTKLLDVGEDLGFDLFVVNPVDYYNIEENKQQSEDEIREYDLAHVISSDIIVVNLVGLATSEDTKIELHDGNYHHKIPVIAFGNRELYENLHPWNKENITRVEKDIDSVVEYIREFYLQR